MIIRNFLNCFASSKKKPESLPGYNKFAGSIEGVKEGILLEAGYDTVAPNMPVTITSWAFEKARSNTKIDIIDNRAQQILCYDYRYTFVEKLQTIAAKFRKETKTGEVTTNYMRQYYDVYSLLSDKRVQEFIGSYEYLEHKKKRFSHEDFTLSLNKNEAFLLHETEIRNKFQSRYEATKALYYSGQPPFQEIMKRILEYIDKL